MLRLAASSLTTCSSYGCPVANDAMAPSVTRQEQAVALVSSTAMVVEDHMGEHHYNMLMPLLQSALNSLPPSKDYRQLRGRTLECISLLGNSVPKERFGADVMPVMQAMAAAQDQGMEDDDPTKVRYPVSEVELVEFHFCFFPAELASFRLGG